MRSNPFDDNTSTSVGAPMAATAAGSSTTSGADGTTTPVVVGASVVSMGSRP